jgi:hypothetical protein
MKTEIHQHITVPLVLYFGIWSLPLQDRGQLARKCQKKIYGIKRIKITIRQPHSPLPLINMNPIKFFRSNALYVFSRTPLTQNPEPGQMPEYQIF